MATVIKQPSEIAGGVRRFSSPPTGRYHSSVIDPKDAQIAELQADLARIASQLKSARDDADRAAVTAQNEASAAVARARDEGVAEGREAGFAAAETRERDRQTAIRDGMTAEAKRFATRLDAMDGLAAMLARECLAKIFARPEGMADMVCAALERHLKILRHDATLAVMVSGADFIDIAALSAVVRESGTRAAITIDPDLPGGACRVSARLGNVDLDVPAQWLALAALLDEMAAA